MGLDNGVAEVVVPFEFEFFGVRTTTITVSVNGVIVMHNNVMNNTRDNEAFPEPDDPDGLIAIWWDNLRVLDFPGFGLGLYYQVYGSTPNRQLVVQWTGVRHSAHTDLIFRSWNFQVALHESSNEIDLIYGSSGTYGNLPTSGTPPYNASVGVENQNASVGVTVLSCTPACDGRPLGHASGSGEYPENKKITLRPRP